MYDEYISIYILYSEAASLCCVRDGPLLHAMGARALWQTLCLAMSFTVAVFLHILSCALYDNWWLMLILIGYALMPIPLCLFARANAGDIFDSHKGAQHWAEFTTTMLISVIVGVPFILVHLNIVELGAALLELAGFLLICMTVGIGFFFAHSNESDSWGGGVSLFSS